MMETAAQLFNARPAPADRRAGPAPALFPPAAEPCRAGYAETHAHHGEVVQGIFYSADGVPEHGLVTLPCALFRTRARFRPLRSGPLTIEPGDRTRARTAARMTLDFLGYTGWGGSVRIEGNVPLQWGCGSSTTDVLTVIRAVADAFGAALEPAWIARIAVASETASDSLMYGPDRAVLFAQRRGAMLRDLGGPLPRVRVLGFNTEGDRGVETLALPPIPYSAWEVEAYRAILGLLCRAVEQQDPVLLGHVATASSRINQRHRPKRHMSDLFALAREVRALGVQVAHSGTVAGLLFEPGGDADARIEQARTRIAGLGLGDSWEFSTDLSTQPEAVS
jgi:uncharacterized protein involved in propanediol utilization